MAVVLLCAFVVLEALLTAYRINTKSVQNKITALLRVAELAIVLACAALSVGELNFRHHAFLIALGLPATASALSFFRNKESRGEFCADRAYRRAAGMAALLFAASLPAIIFPQYDPLPTNGGYSVATSVRYFVDEGRTNPYGDEGEPRILPVEFWYPNQAEGVYPLIVFSHGSFGIRSSNETLFHELASHGYVVCSIDHTYQCFYTRLENRGIVWMDGGYANEIRAEDAKKDKARSLELYQKWMGVRTQDINFVIDAVISGTGNDPVCGLVNPKKIGVMGHSLGGSAALGVGRLRSDIGAVVALESPFLCDITAAQGDSFVFDESEYPVPVLNVYSDGSWDHLGEWPQYAENARLLSGGDKDAYSLHIAGAGHLSLTDLSLSSPFLTRILNGHGSSVDAEECLTTVNRVCLSFYDCFLKGIGSFDGQ